MATAHTPLTPGTLAGLLYNRDRLASADAGKLTARDVTVLTDLRALALQYEIVAGLPIDHGTVADEAAMLALHSPSSETPTPRWVKPGDLCSRTDTPGLVWLCRAGHGTAAAEWLVLPTSATTASLAAALQSYQPLDADLTAIAALSTTEWGRSLLTLGDAGAAKQQLGLTPSDVGLGAVSNAAQLNADQLETAPALPSDSDSRVPSSHAVRGYVASAVDGRVPKSDPAPGTGVSLLDPTTGGVRKMVAAGIISLSVAGGVLTISAQSVYNGLPNFSVNDYSNVTGTGSFATDTGGWGWAEEGNATDPSLALSYDQFDGATAGSAASVTTGSGWAEEGTAIVGN